MTFRELLTLVEPDKVGIKYTGGCYRCPHTYNYEDEAPDTCGDSLFNNEKCYACWNRAIPREKLLELFDRYKLSGDYKIAEEIRKACFKDHIYDDELGADIAKAVKSTIEAQKFDIQHDGDLTPVANPEKLEELVKSTEPHIKDSGDRTEFESGAVRDRRVGKGRCDLMPLDVVGDLMPNPNAREILQNIYEFQETGDVTFLRSCLFIFCEHFRLDTHMQRMCHMFLEVAKHFEEGCAKYGENNWRKGIPVYCYIDSAVRHYLKYLRGDSDEPHGRAFCWNIMCCIWTVEHLNNEGENKDANNG